MKKLMLIVNPHAGRQQFKGFLLSLLDMFYTGGFEPTVFPTQNKAHTLETVRTRAEGFDLVVCCGGDGTLNEVISGLMTCPCPPPLGYIPSGTTNDLATSLGIPKDALEAGRAILEGAPFSYDIGRFNERYFSYVAAFGAFTSVSYQTPQALKNTLGHMAYVLEGMKRLPEIQSSRLKITYDGQAVEDDYVFGAVTNSTSIAGLFRLRAEEVDFADGLFEVMLIRAPQNVMELRRILSGLLTQIHDREYVHFFHTASLRVEALGAPVAWSLDGEDGRPQSQAEIRNLPSALRLILRRPNAPREE